MGHDHYLQPEVDIRLQDPPSGGYRGILLCFFLAGRSHALATFILLLALSHLLGGQVGLSIFDHLTLSRRICSDFEVDFIILYHIEHHRKSLF